jgi:hypothetical protein
MPEQEPGWLSDATRRLLAEHAAILARLHRAESDLADSMRERIASDALAAREHRELRDEYLAGFKAIEKKLEGLKMWAIGVLGALVINLLIFIINQMGKVLAAINPR